MVKVTVKQVKKEEPVVEFFKYPSKGERTARLQEIDSEIKPLIDKINELQKPYNELILERDILLRLEQLDAYAKGEISLEVTQENK